MQINLNAFDTSLCKDRDEKHRFFSANTLLGFANINMSLICHNDTYISLFMNCVVLENFDSEKGEFDVQAKRSYH